MMAAAPRVVVIGADEGVRIARAARLADHYGVPRLPAVDLLIRRQPLPADGYVVDGAPQLLDRMAGTGGLLPALAFADLVVLLHGAEWNGADEACRVLRYYEARGVLAAFPPHAPDGDLVVAIDAALRGRLADPPERPGRP
ncbi:MULTISPECIES: hypothetical protein [Streptomyces]|uniref:Uncharacterized protein n=1 Tax=Streptomyces nigrescens TaxID=1920 RepID=A0ABY7IZD2_STRNI|nr:MULTISPECIES: hypothetical protein [Streptomyces]MYT14444.1 hypothetical protein [Streptomyces sp. SID4951]WAU03663.1 hypothetical protein STRNI_001827 [Streptomyces nigrescens]SCK59803.1 hypothetical protein YWIDRAFT_03841 [Streptomyces sp. SceaMP-e96]